MNSILQLQEFPIEQIRGIMKSLGIKNFTKLDNGNIEIQLVEGAISDKIIQNIIDSMVKEYVNTLGVSS